MQDKNLKQTHLEMPQREDQHQADRIVAKQSYHKPELVSYGPLTKNITGGFVSGDDVESAFGI